MKTILVLSNHPDFAETIRASLNPEQYRVVHRLNVEEAEPLLMHGLAGACILDVDLMGVEGVWVIERLRRRDAKRPSSPTPPTASPSGRKKPFCTASPTC
jgi:DNA-binding response OmpR family regulator